MLRIVGGSARGRKLLGPDGLQFRPTTGRVKEFVFSFLGEEIVGTRILDLFACTGSLGIEALSRGAREAVFVERSLKNVRLITNNLERSGFWEKARILKGDVFSLLPKLAREDETFDFLLADPPFKESLRGPILNTVDENDLLKPKGLLIIEHEFHDTDPGGHGMNLIKKRRFGHCIVSIYD